MKWTEEQLEDLQKVLLSAFPTRDSLRMLLEYDLHENLDTITDADGLEATVFKLITWANARGRIAELLKGAETRRPHNEVLRNFIKALPSDWYNSVRLSTAQSVNLGGTAIPAGNDQLPVIASGVTSTGTSVPDQLPPTKLGSSRGANTLSPVSVFPSDPHLPSTAPAALMNSQNRSPKNSSTTLVSSNESIRPFTTGEWKGFVIASGLAIIGMSLFELTTYSLPLSWLVNHQNSVGLQVGIDLMLALLLYSLFLPRRRAWILSVGVFGLLLVIVQILGGPGSIALGTVTTPTPTR